MIHILKFQMPKKQQFIDRINDISYIYFISFYIYEKSRKNKLVYYIYLFSFFVYDKKNEFYLFF